MSLQVVTLDLCSHRKSDQIAGAFIRVQKFAVLSRAVPDVVLAIGDVLAGLLANGLGFDVVQLLDHPALEDAVALPHGL